MIMCINGFTFSMIYRMRMGNSNAICTDVCMPVLKRILCDKNINRHKKSKQQPYIFPDKNHLLTIFGVKIVYSGALPLNLYML